MRYPKMAAILKNKHWYLFSLSYILQVKELVIRFIQNFVERKHLPDTGTIVSLFFNRSKRSRVQLVPLKVKKLEG